MIISASRRTDIPSYYSDWFFNRLKEGIVYVRNPMNFHRVSKIDLSPTVVDGIVFWTKNPLPMLSRLQELSGYSYYFQFTLNSYQNDVEVNIPSKNNFIIPSFQRLADAITPQRIIWRYDPIFLSEKYNIEYHIEYFEQIAKRLHGYSHRCTISFIDYYRNTENNIKSIGIKKLTIEDKELLAKNLSYIAKKYNFIIDTCAENIELEKYGISHARCIDKNIFENISGVKFKIEKDKSQRFECGCVISIDIGMYNTCDNNCKYCYANYSNKSVHTNLHKHNPMSPVICGDIEDKDVVTERKMASNKINIQGKLFEKMHI